MGTRSSKGNVEILKMSGESGTPCGTLASVIKPGPMKFAIFIRIFLSFKKLVMILIKRGGRRNSWKRTMSFWCHTLSKAPLMSLEITDTL